MAMKVDISLYKYYKFIIINNVINRLCTGVYTPQRDVGVTGYFWG